MVPSPSPPGLSPHGPFPRAFGRYRIDGHLGRGGMGNVYRARDEVLQIDVALKVPRADVMANPVDHERFLHEARAAARLDHPNFARVSNVGVHEGTFYLALRYVPGRPLSECPPRDPVAAAELIHTLAVALAEAHR